MSRHESYLTIPADSLMHELNSRAWSAQELSRRSGVSPTTISCLMHGRPISPRSAQKIMEALDKHRPRLRKLLEPREVA